MKKTWENIHYYIRSSNQREPRVGFSDKEIGTILKFVPEIDNYWFHDMLNKQPRRSNTFGQMLVTRGNLIDCAYTGWDMRNVAAPEKKAEKKKAAVKKSKDELRTTGKTGSTEGTGSPTILFHDVDGTGYTVREGENGSLYFEADNSRQRLVVEDTPDTDDFDLEVVFGTEEVESAGAEIVEEEEEIGEELLQPEDTPSEEESPRGEWRTFSNGGSTQAYQPLLVEVEMARERLRRSHELRLHELERLTPPTLGSNRISEENTNEDEQG